MTYGGAPTNPFGGNANQGTSTATGGSQGFSSSDPTKNIVQGGGNQTYLSTGNEPIKKAPEPTKLETGNTPLTEQAQQVQDQPNPTNPVTNPTTTVNAAYKNPDVVKFGDYYFDVGKKGFNVEGIEGKLKPGEKFSSEAGPGGKISIVSDTSGNAKSDLLTLQTSDETFTAQPNIVDLSNAYLNTGTMTSNNPEFSIPGFKTMPDKTIGNINKIVEDMKYGSLYYEIKTTAGGPSSLKQLGAAAAVSFLEPGRIILKGTTEERIGLGVTTAAVIVAPEIVGTGLVGVSAGSNVWSRGFGSGLATTAAETAPFLLAGEGVTKAGKIAFDLKFPKFSYEEVVKGGNEIVRRPDLSFRGTEKGVGKLDIPERSPGEIMTSEGQFRDIIKETGGTFIATEGENAFKPEIFINEPKPIPTTTVFDKFGNPREITLRTEDVRSPAQILSDERGLRSVIGETGGKYIGTEGKNAFDLEMFFKEPKAPYKPGYNTEIPSWFESANKLPTKAENLPLGKSTFGNLEFNVEKAGSKTVIRVSQKEPYSDINLGSMFKAKNPLKSEKSDIGLPNWFEEKNALKLEGSKLPAGTYNLRDVLRMSAKEEGKGLSMESKGSNQLLRLKSPKIKGETINLPNWFNEKNQLKSLEPKKPSVKSLLNTKEPELKLPELKADLKAPKGKTGLLFNLMNKGQTKQAAGYNYSFKMAIKPGNTATQKQGTTQNMKLNSPNVNLGSKTILKTDTSLKLGTSASITNARIQSNQPGNAGLKMGGLTGIMSGALSLTDLRSRRENPLKTKKKQKREGGFSLRLSGMKGTLTNRKRPGIISEGISRFKFGKSTTGKTGGGITKQMEKSGLSISKFYLGGGFTQKGKKTKAMKL